MSASSWTTNDMVKEHGRNTVEKSLSESSGAKNDGTALNMTSTATQFQPIKAGLNINDNNFGLGN